MITKDNPKIIEDLTDVKVLGTLPWTQDEAALKKAFGSIGIALWDRESEHPWRTD